MKDFPGEEVAHIGPFEFSVSDKGHWDVSYITRDTALRRRAYITLVGGKTISLKRARMRCERFARTLVESCDKIRRLTK